MVLMFVAFPTFLAVIWLDLRGRRGWALGESCEWTLGRGCGWVLKGIVHGSFSSSWNDPINWSHIESSTESENVNERQQC